MRLKNALMNIAPTLIAAALCAAALQQTEAAEVSLTPPPGPMPSADGRVDIRPLG